ncbi:[protein-PII] uridylyltransferase [Marinagarivorans algicola]|uniref:[protein-PII] uridylyltransferase n=1 Tax=Marinagarivorans algicola TaxID=1513270 RepID=UPI0006B4B24A|nr:[protein-PII] uridylyltransferase [Marinagarivorans algicola]
MTHSVPIYACQPLCFNQRLFRKNLTRQPLIKVFKDAIAGINEHLDNRFLEGEDVRSLIAERAHVVDILLHYAWHQNTFDDDISLIAVGGYGRSELHPKSDVDILILLDDSAETKYSEQLQTFITLCWDIGLDIGSSVRTLSQCVELAKNDITVATNLLDCRRLCGSDALRDQLHTLTNVHHIWPASAFYHAKLQEQIDRHKKHNDSEYNLEPNIKKSPGGLRDIQTIHWVAKRYYGVKTLQQLQNKNFFTEYEYGVLNTCEATLWKIRYALHYVAGRADERLLFEYQRELASLFGYEDSDKGLAVEQFMRTYYRAVLALRELNDVLLQSLNEKIHDYQNAQNIQPLNDNFQLRDGYIEVIHNNVFKEYPPALLEIFVLLGNNPSIKGVRTNTIRLLNESRFLIDEEFRQNPINKQLFLQLFKVERGLVTQLKRMKRYNILGRYLPAFGKITGQMQHDLFHRYTVDDHTLLVIQKMRHFTLPSAEQEFPIAAHILKRINKPEILYLAGLFHDIGKGRGGDHSTLGAQDAIEFGQSHGLTSNDTKLLAWLVQSHLLMSYVSQKQDTSEPDVIHAFALKVGNQRNLDYLYALTVADMNGTNPDIWNSWRASLMRQLYTETKRALRRGLENTLDQAEYIEETKQHALNKLQDRNVDLQKAQDLWQDMGSEYFVREGHIDIAWQTEAIIEHNTQSDHNKPLILVRDDTTLQWGGATQIFIRMPDQGNVFLAAATVFAQLGLNIHDARIYNSDSGHTIDTFYVLDENDQPVEEGSTKEQKILDALHEELKHVIQGEYSDVIKKRTPRLLKQFPIPTRTKMETAEGANYTTLEVISPDRHNLLATIGQVFLDHDILVCNAKISTLGERVEDIFFITDANGNTINNQTTGDALQKAICQALDQEVEASL